MDLTALINNYLLYVFGNPLYAGIAMVFMVALIGIRFGWSLETHVIVLVPTIALFGGYGVAGVVGGYLPIWLWLTLFVGLGFMLGMAIVTLIRR